MPSAPAENVLVIGAIALLWHYPVAVFLFLCLLFAFTFYFLPKIWRSISMNLWFISRKLNQISGTANSDQLPAKLPSRYDALFRRLTGNASTVAWAVPCVSGKGRYLEPNRFGYLVASHDEPSKVWFITRTMFGSASKMLEIEQFKFSLERRLLFEELKFYSLGKNRRFIFKFDCASAGLAAKVAAALENRLEPSRSLTLTEPGAREDGSSGVAEDQELQKKEMQHDPMPARCPRDDANPLFILQLLNSCNSFFLRQPVLFQNLLGVRLIDSQGRQGDFLLNLFAIHDLQSLPDTLCPGRCVQEGRSELAF